MPSFVLLNQNTTRIQFYNTKNNDKRLVLDILVCAYSKPGGLGPTCCKFDYSLS